MKLSILICHMTKRIGSLNALLGRLNPQLTSEVEVLIDADPVATTGAKRNALLDKATGDYVVFVDDDDLVADTYVALILKAMEGYPEAIGISGWMTTNGVNQKSFQCSFENKGWSEEGSMYLRPIMHICPVRRSIACQARFPNTIRSEDSDYARRLMRVLTSGAFIDEQIYFYLFQSKGKPFSVLPPVAATIDLKPYVGPSHVNAGIDLKPYIK